jgi:hypothetical protein
MLIPSTSIRPLAVPVSHCDLVQFDRIVATVFQDNSLSPLAELQPLARLEPWHLDQLQTFRTYHEALQAAMTRSSDAEVWAATRRRGRADHHPSGLLETDD